MLVMKIKMTCPVVAVLTASIASFSSVGAATITGGGISSSVSAVDGGSATNEVGVFASSTLLKFVGDINLTAPGGGSTVGNTITTSGSLTLDSQDAFLLSYDFDVTLVGGGTVTLTTTATTDFGGVLETITNTETLTEAGTVNLTFSGLGTVATGEVSGSWTGQLSFDWVDAPENSSLLISIPNESIDFAVTAVPEPSAAILAALGGMAFLRRRRR